MGNNKNSKVDVIRINEVYSNMQIQDLNNCVFVDIGKAADMFWIIFDDNNSKISLHLQCRFRICMAGEIFLSNTDVYSDNYDSCIQNTVDLLRTKKIVSVECNKYRDLVINFDNGCQLVTFNVYNSHNHGKELWRLFVKNAGVHLVARSDGLFEE